ncbi:hypothetical protein [Fuchsiella alkaliacetigena]|uniref:hypothetical protein n=1 Tax=Fuchsiella alkaliacetigena TaxID=957042 RepID=UPI00200B3D97|nr:hypothetical protein [Fuchsiella alkaliacetigena]MCK8824673.1 hypothetical protein [Fuchsiella alkaliacetigena]
MIYKISKSKLVSLLICLMVVLILAGCIPSASNPFSSDDGDGSEIVWDTYVTDDFGIKYPSEWEIVEESSNFVWIRPSEESDFLFEIEGVIDKGDKDNFLEVISNFIEYWVNSDEFRIINWQGYGPENYKIEMDENSYDVYEFEVEIINWENEENFDKFLLTSMHNEGKVIHLNYLGLEYEYNNNLDIAKEMVKSFEFLN